MCCDFIESPAFKPIPLDKIGPYESTDRTSWPIVKAEGFRDHPLIVVPME